TAPYFVTLPISVGVVSSDRAEFTLDLNDDSTTPLDVWIEYGKTSSFGEGTAVVAVNKTEWTGFSTSVSGLQESTTYYYKVHVRDLNENEAVLEGSFITSVADTTAPDSFTINTFGTVSGPVQYTVSDLAATDVVRVSFEIKPTALDRIIFANDFEAPFTVVLDTTEFVDGNYQVRAVAYDAAGNAGYSNTDQITVDNAEYYTVDEIDAKISTLETSINTNTLAISTLQTQVDTLSQNVSDNSDAVGVIQTEIVALQLQSSNNAGDIVTLQGLVDVLRTDVDANVADIAALDARLTTLETTSGTMQTDLTALETKLNAFLAFTVMDTTAELFEYPNTVTVTGTTSEVATCTAYDQYGNSLGSMTTADGLAHSFVVTSPEAGTTPFELRCATADYTKSAYSAYDYLMYYAINEPDTERGFGYVGATRNPYPFWMSTNALNAANLTNVTVENVLLGGLSTLESDDVDVLWSYNPSTDSWDSYKPGNVANTFTDFTATLGYYELEYLATGFGKYIRHTKVN
ncbi:hypothetical protein HOJ75_00640, partial [Candidatus Woesearchaeota archaeon]|nr:hypothetical protein [Candidatus Woesearchaeota archaeon]